MRLCLSGTLYFEKDRGINVYSWNVLGIEQVTVFQESGEGR